jgi:hypothetical protein
MEKVQKPSNSDCDTPSSKQFMIYRETTISKEYICKLCVLHLSRPFQSCKIKTRMDIVQLTEKLKHSGYKFTSPTHNFNIQGRISGNKFRRDSIPMYFDKNSVLTNEQ